MHIISFFFFFFFFFFLNIPLNVGHLELSGIVWTESLGLCNCMDFCLLITSLCFGFSPTCIPFQHGLSQSLWDWGHFYVQKVEFFNDAHLQFPKIDLKQV